MVNPLLLNIINHILYTVFYTFPKVLTRRISIASLFGDHFLYCYDL